MAKSIEHDPLLCGLPRYDGTPPCPACAAEDAGRDLVERWPHLARVADHPANHIAGNVVEQMRRARSARPVKPLSRRAVARVLATVRAYPEEFRAVLLDLLAEPVGRLVAGLLPKPKRRRKKENAGERSA
jgi:hypothetical protein